MIGLVSYLVFFGCIVLILGTMALGLNLQWGYTGLFNAGIVGFYAIGAYTHAILTAAPRPELIGNLGLPWLFGIAGAMATTAFAAWIVGLATIRLRGDYLAISTFGIAIAIQLVTLNWEGLTGGVQGLSAIPRPLVGWFETPFGFNLWYFCLLLAVVGAGLLGVGADFAFALGPRPQGDTGGRDSSHCAGQECSEFSSAGLRAGLDADGSLWRAVCQLHRLCQPVRFPAYSDVPDMGDGDRRR